jgi:hypothetical protein
MTEQDNNATPLSAAVHAIHNLKQHREDPRNNPFPGEAIGILDRFVREAGARMASPEAAAFPADIADPVLYDQWVHEQLFANPPKGVTPFDAWKAGRTLERQNAALAAGGPPSQRALFEVWWRKNEIANVSAREAKLRAWYGALDAQPDGEFDISQEWRFDAWLAEGAQSPRLAAAREKMKALLNKHNATSQEMHAGYLELSDAIPQDEKDKFFVVWEAALAANR